MEKGTQEFPRYIPYHSMVPHHYKIGMQITTYPVIRPRIKRKTTNYCHDGQL